MGEYTALLETDSAREMRAYARAFADTNASALATYGQRWVKNPMEHWSRLWEYPFVYESIAEAAGRSGPRPLRVLDAGSGATFFPYFLMDHLTNLEVTCWDSDASLAAIHEALNAGARGRARFEVRDLQAPPDVARPFDVIYCISVLEHLPRRDETVRAFRKMLARGGLLVVTFDVSLEHGGEIPLAEARGLARHLETVFPSHDESERASSRDLAIGGDALTTRSIRAWDPRLLPWRPSIRGAIASLVRLRPSLSHFNNLTCYCGAYRA